MHVEIQETQHGRVQITKDKGRVTLVEYMSRLGTTDQDKPLITVDCSILTRVDFTEDMLKGIAMAWGAVEFQNIMSALAMLGGAQRVADEDGIAKATASILSLAAAIDLSLVTSLAKNTTGRN